MELHLAINNAAAPAELPAVHEVTHVITEEAPALVEEAPAPPPSAVADSPPETPQAPKRRPKKPPVEEKPAHITQLESVTSPADGWVKWQELIGKADAAELRALKAYWMIWSGKHVSVAQKVGKAVSQEISKREAQLGGT